MKGQPLETQDFCLNRKRFVFRQKEAQEFAGVPLKRKLIFIDGGKKLFRSLACSSNYTAISSTVLKGVWAGRRGRRELLIGRPREAVWGGAYLGGVQEKLVEVL